MVFVDGLGLGSRDPAVNPLYAGNAPSLCALLDDHALPVDAAMGVPGLPQSATGQTALLTGINAAAAVGRHVEGFPGESLRAIIREHNIFRQLQGLGRPATFANAYYTDDIAAVRSHRLQSVTTVATLGAFGTVRTRDELLRNAAVYQDLTRAALRPQGYTGPLVTPEESAAHLVALAARHAFTLFEYFQTDRAGHAADPAFTARVLGELDRFVGVLINAAPAAGLEFVLTSDHGNIEDARTRLHTANPVPLASVGPAPDDWRREIRAITDIAPALVNLLR